MYTVQANAVANKNKLDSRYIQLLVLSSCVKGLVANISSLPVFITIDCQLAFYASTFCATIAILQAAR